MKNLHHMKELEYLNLALNNISKVSSKQVLAVVVVVVAVVVVVVDSALTQMCCVVIVVRCRNLCRYRRRHRFFFGLIVFVMGTP